MNRHQRTRPNIAVAQAAALVLFLALGAMVVFDQARANTIGIGPRVDDCTAKDCHPKFRPWKKKGDKGKKNVHEAACDACHEETDEEKHKFKLTAEEPDLCTECHDEVTEDLKFQHGPLAAGQCTVCHDPHGSDHPKLLTATGPALCTECHDELGERLEEEKQKHDPVVKDCLSCHKAHGADNKMLLTAEQPDLCTECHDAIADTIDEAKVKHGAVTQKPCTACHDPHVSAEAHLLRDNSKNICLGCHAKPIKVGKRVILGLGELLTKRKNHHGPISKNECTTCHRGAHGGATRHLLAGAYPSRFYVPFDAKLYSLCFECHDTELVEEEEDEDVTSFRNGDRNLHFVHVNKKKGRSCRACHEVHASSGPALISESVPFGKRGWRFPMNFKQTKTGGSCGPGCHKKYGYDREKPVTNLEP